ncbi:enolase C-terminal domain-like protein [Blattabacterium cuenoti]|uniref:enolase C-terminal domain-like protein n=1 Tax=Blattabacterium cuenoti TaxID=1653831 RepID=UPI00163C6AD1|nr:enolase C-terminal domain-like protein [Blattabacterium cuenoti]
MHIKSTLKKCKFFFKRKVKNSSRIFEYNVIWFLVVKKENKIGIGECNPLLDQFAFYDLRNYEKELQFLSEKINFLKKTESYYYSQFISYSSIFFGLEQVFLSLKNKFPILYNSDFTNGKLGLPINSLIWLDSSKESETKLLFKKIEKEIFKGFSFIKMKIDSKSFDHKYSLLKEIKKKYPNVKIRVDANGTFISKENALYCINKLFDLDIVHYIEQPILSGNWNEMSFLCKNSKLPVALDEELVTVFNLELKKKLLDIIRPHYIVIKPNICGGFVGTKEWISEAEKRKIGYCISSSLESNIGINAISQWTFNIFFRKKNHYSIVHGLNTGYFYINNFDSPLKVEKGYIWYDPLRKWKIKNLIQMI